MSIGKPPPLDQTLVRFESALTRLETALTASMARVTDAARRTGYEEGHQAGLREIQEARGYPSTPDLNPLLQEELDAAKAREMQLQRAVEEARAALKEAMGDIRAALSPL
ncbi:MAG: hypothetical protein ACK5WH_07380 [Hyphomonadaceae bacterium]